MKKLFAVVIAFLGLSFSISSHAQQDAKAKAVLEKMSQKVKSMSSMKANFAVIATDANGKEILNQKGTLHMKGEKYNVALPKQELICDGKTMWTYLKDNKEVQVASYNPDEVQISPKKLFPTSYASEYHYYYAGEKVVKGKKVDIIYLKPKTTKEFKSVTLLIEKSGMLLSGSVEENGGSYYTFNLNNVQINGGASDALYSFDTKKHPGVEVIDLR